MNYLVTCLLYLMVFSASAATFIPTKVIDRMKNTDGAIEGTYLGHSYKKIANGDVVTEHVFKVGMMAGLRPSEIISKNSFKVIVPGGTWNKLTYKVSGSPSFKVGENVVLMISRGKYGYILPDLVLSKFSIEIKGKEKYLISEVFTNKEGVGKISFNEFNQLADGYYGEELKSYNINKFVYQKKAAQKKINGRSVASYSNEKSDNNKTYLSSFMIFWLIVALGSIGAIGMWVNRGTKE